MNPTNLEELAEMPCSDSMGPGLSTLGLLSPVPAWARYSELQPCSPAGAAGDAKLSVCASGEVSMCESISTEKRERKRNEVQRCAQRFCSPKLCLGTGGLWRWWLVTADLAGIPPRCVLGSAVLLNLSRSLVSDEAQPQLTLVPSFLVNTVGTGQHVCKSLVAGCRDAMPAPTACLSLSW